MQGFRWKNLIKAVTVSCLWNCVEYHSLPATLIELSLRSFSNIRIPFEPGRGSKAVIQISFLTKRISFFQPCTEQFFLTLFSQFREDMTVEMARYIKSTQGHVLNDESDLKSILAKDAIYNAAGLVSFTLYDEVRQKFLINHWLTYFIPTLSQIDFDQWFTNQLVHEIKIKGNRFRIIRRRAIWLIGQWTGVKFNRQLRPQVYAACLHLIEPSEDMCVRITASK